jgi:hypothetical protein
MKKLISNIVALVLAIFFFFSGSGLNIVKYCCDICSEHGIQEVAANSCESLHHHNNKCCESKSNHANDLQDDMTCSNTSHHPQGCHVLRLNVETPTIVNSNQLKIHDINFVVLFANVLFSNSTLLVNCTDHKNFHSPPNFSHHSGREILSNKSVLII